MLLLCWQRPAALSQRAEKQLVIIMMSYGDGICGCQWCVCVCVSVFHCVTASDAIHVRDL